MATQIDPGDLHKKWVHSHEEDTPGEMVFRPAGYPFPLSRGRTSFELKPDGSLQQTGIAPDDRHGLTGEKGSWKLTGKNALAFYDAAGGGKPQKVLTLDSVSADKMVVKK